MISYEQRKPDGGLGAWIETMEAMGSGGEDAELLCLNRYGFNRHLRVI
ncbi:hypothetical protein [Pantoea sp. Seng]|nr:hypothetical protein [Pantoea sp. Seng]